MIQTATSNGRPKLARLFYITGIQQDLQENCQYPLALYCVRQFALTDPEVARNWKIEIVVLDFEFQHEQVLFELQRDDVSLVGFSCYLWNYQKSFRLAEKLKLIRPNLPIVFGGPQVADAARVLAERPYVDFVVTGEGEIPFRSLLLSGITGVVEADLGQVRGLSYRNEDAAVIGAEAEQIDLAEMPTLYQASEPGHLSGTVILETSRGCPYGCRFCFWGDTQMRYYPISRVERDLEFILRQPQVDGLFIIDAELDIDRERAREVLRAVKRHNVRGIPISGFLAFARWDDELIRLCKECGLQLGIGIQSLSEETLRTAGRHFLKRAKAEKILAGIQPYYAKNEVQLQFMIGMPGDTYESIRANFAWCIERGYFRLGVNRLFVLPGTAFYQDEKLFGLIRDPGGYHAVYGNSTLAYADILRAEFLLSGLRLYAHYLDRVSPTFWRTRGLEPIEVCERLGDGLSRAGIAFVGRQESEAPEFAARQSVGRAGLEVLQDVMARLLPPDDAVRVQDLARFLWERELCAARLEARLQEASSGWRAFQGWNGPGFEIYPLELRSDIARFVSDAEFPLDEVAIEPTPGLFLLVEHSGKVTYVREVSGSGTRVVEVIAQVIARQNLLMGMGVPREDAEAAFPLGSDLQGYYHDLVRLLRADASTAGVCPVP